VADSRQKEKLGGLQALQASRLAVNLWRTTIYD